MWSAAFIGYQLPSDNGKSGWNAYVSAQKQKLDAGEFSDPEGWESSSESELAGKFSQVNRRRCLTDLDVRIFRR